MADLILRKNPPPHILPENRRGQRIRQAVGAYVCCDFSEAENRNDAIARKGGPPVDPPNRGMAVRAAHKSGMQHGRQDYVIDKPSGTAQQFVVFNALDGFAEKAHELPRMTRAASKTASTI